MEDWRLFRAHRGLPKNNALIKFLSEPGIRVKMQKTENYYLADQQKEMPKVDAELYFTIDEKNNQVDLTDKGITLITKSGKILNFLSYRILPQGLQILKRTRHLPKKNYMKKNHC